MLSAGGSGDAQQKEMEIPCWLKKNSSTRTGRITLYYGHFHMDQYGIRPSIMTAVIYVPLSADGTVRVPV